MLRVENLRVKRGEFSLHVEFLEVETHEFVSVLGPSGSGKTTLLESLAGFIKPESGKILFYGHDITHKSPWKRHIAISYQEPFLFPHLTVFENLTYGKGACEKFVKNLAERLKIGDLLDRYPHQLSAGQKQRVSLIRACASRPMMLLMDEPFNFLDVRAKEDLRELISWIREEFLMPIILVTHDFEEALYYSDRIVILEEGRIRGIASPYELVKRPPDEFVSQFLWSSNYIPVEERDGKYFFGSQEIYLPQRVKKKRFVVMLRPQDIILQKDLPVKSSARNHLRGFVLDITRGHKVNEVRVKVEDSVLSAYITQGALDDLDLKVNNEVYLVFKATALQIFDPE